MTTRTVAIIVILIGLVLAAILFSCGEWQTHHQTNSNHTIVIRCDDPHDTGFCENFNVNSNEVIQ